MTDPQQRRRRQPDPAAMRRSGMDAIGNDLAARVPPPIPPGLGEGLLEQAYHPRNTAMADSFDPSEIGSRERMMVALARIEERQIAIQDANKAGQAAAEARHTNIMQAIATFVPRSEIEKDNRALGGRIDDLEKRIGNVERRIWSAVAAILTTVLSAIAGVFALTVKH